MARPRSAEKRWEEVFNSWMHYAVPDVCIVPYRLAVDHPDLPWSERETHRQVSSSNPERTTAYHLAVYLQGKPAEVLAAYKLYAFAKDRAFKLESLEVLQVGFRSGREDVAGWWSQNSRYVLPFVEQPQPDVGTCLKAFDWTEFVQGAATAWGAVAAKYEIVLIPDFMCHDSPERTAYDEFDKQRSEAIERAEFERLKKKFEKNA